MDPLADVLRLAAFPSEPGGGNPAGVVLDARCLSAARMQQIAADVDYAESAFVVRPATAEDPGRIGIRYFSPTAEVPFCGHATIATAVALAERGPVRDFVFETGAGNVADTTATTAGGTTASFTSVEPYVQDFDGGVLARLLQLLGVGLEDLDPAYPPRLAFAGNVHPVIVLADSGLFDGFTFSPSSVRELMDEQGWAGTVTVVTALGPADFEARNLFPVGRVTEDPATGSAAAAVGAYLRALELVRPPARVRVRQGRHVGRPSLLTVDVPATGGITVTGTASVVA